jgi:transposase
MHLRMKRISGRDYLYAVDNAWRNGRSEVAFQTYLGRPQQLSGSDPKPLVRTFHFGSAAVLLELARSLQVREIVDQVVGPSSQPSVGDYILMAALNRAIKPTSKNAFAAWYERTSLKRLHPIPARKLTSQRFWDAMHQIDAQQCQQIYHRIALKAIEVFKINDELTCFDTSNFFTYIASDNDRPELPQRGHSKAKRHDLRLISYALACTARDQLPLFHHVYAGNVVDSVVFDRLLPTLIKELSDLGQGQATWVYDKGNVSAKNQERIEAEDNLQYVTSLPPSQHADLLAIPLGEMEEVDADRHPQLAGYRVWSCERKVWSKPLQMVMSHSPELAQGQLRGVLQHRDKALQRLWALQDKLDRRTATSRGRKPTLQSVRKQVEEILSAQHMQRLITVEVHVQEGDLVRLRYQLDEDHLEHLQQHLFGRRVWLTTRLDWSPAQVVEVAHKQASVEACFRQMNDPGNCAFQPVRHWTDQKIRVHGLYCTIGLLLVQILRMLARRAGDKRATDKLLEDLDEVQECLVVPTLRSADERPRLEVTLNVIDDAQRKLLGLITLKPATTTPA